MSAAHTASALAQRLHALASDVPGYSASEAHTWTRKEATGTEYFARLSVTINRQVRHTNQYACGSPEEAIDTAFEEIGKSLETLRSRKPKALPQAPKSANNLNKAA